MMQRHLQDWLFRIERISILILPEGTRAHLFYRAIVSPERHPDGATLANYNRVVVELGSKRDVGVNADEGNIKGNYK